MAGVRVFTFAYAGCTFYISCAFAEAYDPLCARHVLIRPRKISLRLATERLVALFQFCFSRALLRVICCRRTCLLALTYRYANSQQ